MATEETTAKKPEMYKGNEIEEIVFGGGTAILTEVKILLKNGVHITLRPKMYLSEYRIIPEILASRGHWGRPINIKRQEGEMESGIKEGLTMGAVIAMILSWEVNHSILWMILHGFCSWFYVIYWAIVK